MSRALAFERETLEVRCVIVALVSSEEGRQQRVCFHRCCSGDTSAQDRPTANTVAMAGVYFDSR